MFEKKEIAAGAISDEELEKVTGGTGVYSGNPADLVGKFVDFVFFTPGPCGGQWKWCGNGCKVINYLGSNANHSVCPYLKSDEEILEIEGYTCIPVSGITAVH